MDTVWLHFVRQRRLDATLPFHARLAGKGFRDDPNVEMGLSAGPSAGMTGMFGAFVVDNELGRRESGL